MTNAISSIEIYNPMGDAYYSRADQSSKEFPITDQCERSAKLMGDDYVRLQFKLQEKITFDAFSFIRYDNQTFFLKEQYVPTPNGTTKEEGGGTSSIYYTYDVKFVSVANMLDKHICYRHVKVGEQEWYEPEININGNLNTMYVIVMGAIKRVAEQWNGIYYGYLLNTIYQNGMAADGINPNLTNVKLTSDTKLLTFNFSGDNIANVCTTIANNFTNDDKKDTEWYITEEHNADLVLTNLTLHFAKCVSDKAEQDFGDYVKKDNSAYSYAHPYTSGGLKKVEYAQSWSGVTQTIVPFGSDRNMSGQSVKGIDEITNMQSTFGKRLRLDVNSTYKVKDTNGVEHEISVDSRGGIRNDFVNTGIEKVVFFDDVYPQGHFRVEKVEIKNKRQNGETIPEYTITALPIDANGNVIPKDALSPTQAGGNGYYPIRIEEGTTLSVRFESGMLAGREFEIANKSHKDYDRPTYSMKFTIVADGSIEDGTLIPSGNFRPYGDLSTNTAEASPTGVGDKFALFNMKMPDVYIEQAKQELAQKAYEELVKVQKTRPEVKCTTDATSFNGDIAFGHVINVNSELFNTEGYTFKSRVISYSYKLTNTSDVQFSLASAIMQGTLSSMNNQIADVTHTTGGLEQRAVNLSRRAWRDASEVAEMLDSITAEMMLVGNEKNQFAFTSAIECIHEGGLFTGLRVGYGTLQHTQSPYIEYANSGSWNINEVVLTKDEVGQPLDANKPYYLYAIVDNTDTPAKLVLNESANDDVPYLLLGILSSEFERERVFSRTNGFTAIEGGTITTEQIQDASRNLIIDFQSNPPRIIARNGAEIIGNIRFLSSDGTSQTINEYLDGSIGGKNLLKQTAFHYKYVAMAYAGFTKIYNLEAGKTYIATWGKFENNAGGATNEVFNGVCLGIGGTSFASTEQVVRFGEPFYVNGNGRFLSIIWCDYSYAKHMIGVDDYTGVETKNDFTQFLDYVMLQEGEVATAFQPSIDEELEEIEQLQDDFQESLDKINSDEWFSVAEKKIIRTNWEAISGLADTSSEPAYYEESGSYGEVSNAVIYAEISTKGVDDAFEALRSFLDNNGVDGLYVDTDWKWGSGGRSTMAGLFTAYYNEEAALWNAINNAYADTKAFDDSSYRYLKEVLTDSKNTTDITGGLVMTNLLMLKDTANAGGEVNAGMSGVEADNILLWGGGSYQDAVEAVESEDYTNNAGKPITSLLKKDGTGKLGVFEVHADRAIIDAKDGVIVIDDNEGLGCYRPTEQNIPVVSVTPTELPLIDEIKQNGEKVTGSNGIYYSGSNVRVDTYGRPDTILSGSSMSVNAGFIGAGGNLVVNGGVRSYYVKESDANEIIVTEEYIMCEVSNSNGIYKTLYLSYQPVSIFIDRADNYTITYTPRIKVEGKMELPWEQDVRYQYNIGFDSTETYGYYTKEYFLADKQTIIAYKGLFSYQGEYAYLYYKDGIGFDCRIGKYRFKISNEGIQFEGLPESAEGLVAGSLYTDGDYVKIVSNRQ